MVKLIAPFKWAGSKIKERRKLRDILGVNEYSIVEPFMGTGVVSGMFGRYQSCYGNDLNPDIVNLFKYAKDPVFDKGARLLLTDEHMNTKDVFQQVRDRFNETPHDTVDRAIMFFFLQNCAHFGLYRVNKHGKYTSTWHYFTKSAQIDNRLGSLRLIADSFYYVTKKDYKEFLKFAPHSVDLYFIDPPYITASYDDYSVDGHFNHDDLHFIDDYCTFLYKEHEICSIICNYQTENDREIYKGSSEIRSFVSARTMNLSDARKVNKKTSIYALYGDFSKTSMKDYL